MKFGDLISDRHKRVARMVGYGLVCDTKQTWADAGAVWKARLTEEERALLAWSFLRTLPTNIASGLLSVTHPRAGYPTPQLDDVADTARWWASLASRDEKLAWATASFQALSPSDQRDFLNHFMKVAA